MSLALNFIYSNRKLSVKCHRSVTNPNILADLPTLFTANPIFYHLRRHSVTPSRSRVMGKWSIFVPPRRSAGFRRFLVQRCRVAGFGRVVCYFLCGVYTFISIIKTPKFERLACIYLRRKNNGAKSPVILK